VVSVTTRPRLTPAKETTEPIVQEAGWVPEPVWIQRQQEKSFRLCPGSNLESSGFPTEILNTFLSGVCLLYYMPCPSHRPWSNRSKNLKLNQVLLTQKKELKNVPFNKVCHETGLRVLQYKLPRVLSHADETIGGSKIRSKDLQA
jgi:hypothetical protein